MFMKDLYRLSKKIRHLFSVSVMCFATAAVSMDSQSPYDLFSGSSNRDLSEKVAAELKMSLGDLEISRFADGEICPKFKANIRNRDIIIVHSLCRTSTTSVNDNIVEAILIADAATRASAKSITFVLPYLGYARQDRKEDHGVAISASVVAKLLEKAGLSRIIMIDLHSGQIQGFFHKTPVDNLYASLIMVPYIKSLGLNNIVVVSPDAGGVNRARKFQTLFKNDGVENISLAIINKEREKAGVVSSATLVGDVRGKTAVLIDDMADTCGTLVAAAQELTEMGAIEIYACITHAVFSGNALEKIRNSKFKKVIVTDTIPLRLQEGETKPHNLEVLSVAPLVAETIRRIMNGGSISELFMNI